SASGHKINGPKGSGFLYVKEEIMINPLLFGGEQEKRRRPGTESVTQIIGLEKAVELAVEYKEERNREYSLLKESFLNKLKKEEIDFNINGAVAQTVPTIVNISFPDIEVEQMLTNLDLEGVAASSGSACTAGS